MKKTIALLGQPNSGKSTVFNGLTGAHQHVGNWPGKTVECKEGTFFAALFLMPKAMACRGYRIKRKE